MAVALILLGLLGLAINLYFLSLMVRLPPWLDRWLTLAARACGVDDGICRQVAQTRHARLLAGLPNVTLGIPWSLLVAVSGAVYLAEGRFPLWGPIFAAALLAALLSLYLTASLVWLVKKPCRL
jgi:hypothetical protein